MINKQYWQRMMMAAVTAGVGTTGYGAATTGWSPEAAGTYSYSDTANWVDGVINNTWDSSLTLAGSQIIQFGDDATLSTNLSFNYAGNSSITFRSDTVDARTISLNADISVAMASNQTVIFGTNNANNNLNVDLGAATRTFTVNASKKLYFYNTVSGSGGIANSGGGSVNLYGVNTYTGDTTANSGAIVILGRGSAADSHGVAAGGTIKFDNAGNGSVDPITRLASVTLQGGAISVAGNTSYNTTDAIAGAMIADRLNSIVAMSPTTGTSGKNAALKADSLVMNSGATILFRGTNLGVNSIASQTGGASNIYFTNAPTLVGGTGAAGTSTVGVMKGSYGDITASGNGTGLVTYDASNGVRLLAASEYTAAITDGQTQQDNVKLAASGGASPITQTIDTDTTIGSLSIGVSAAGSGVTIGGTGELTITSGMIFANQGVTTPTSADAIVINNAAINFNQSDAYIIAMTTGVKEGNTPAPLQINSAITDAASLTKSGSGKLILGGSAANTYTGTTYLTAGVTELEKTIENSAIVGNIVINGGTLFGNSNQIADTSDVTMNGGSWVLKSGATNSGSSTTEIIHDLTMTGGSIEGGYSTNGGSLTVHDLDMSGGTFRVVSAYTLDVQGDAYLSGGAMTVNRSNSNTTYTGNMKVANDLHITNTESGEYAAISLGAGDATHRGGRLLLNGNLHFTGTANNNTVTIGSAAGTDAMYMGVVDLNGATSTFNIGNGAAAVDLAINASIINGGLTKTGAGTLALNGNNTYTGLTTISDGRLAINGTHASDVLINGGTLGGTGTIGGAVTVGAGGTLAAGNSVGTLTVGSLVLDGGSSLQFEFDTTGNDLVIVSAADGLVINGGTVTLIIDEALTLTGAYHLFQYTGALGGSLENLALANSGYELVLSTDGTNNYIDVQVSNVPEPAAITLLAAGGAMLLTRRRRAM